MRKHHNKLYYSKYRFKTLFKMPWTGILYPTTDQKLLDMIQGKDKTVRYLNKEWYKTSPDVLKLAQFIIDNRTKMKFRLQQKYAIFYSDKGLASKLVCDFWEYWKGSTTVNPNAKKLDKNIIVFYQLV